MGIKRNLTLMWRDVRYNKIASSVLLPNALRWRALRLLGVNAEKSYICPNVWVGGPRLTIGHGTFINYRCVFDSQAEIVLGRNCDIAMDVKFITSTHEIGPVARRAGLPISRPIVVGDGVWIGAGAVILPGVTIGKGVVIGAGSVVAKDCDPNTVYIGGAAERTRILDKTATERRS